MSQALGDSYVKDIESYYLSLRGEGIMLSSRDYGLIMRWKRQNIPKDVVFRGINKAFENLSENKGDLTIRSLSQCAAVIEKVAENVGVYQRENYPSGSAEKKSTHSKKRNDRNQESECSQVITRISERLGKIITSEKRQGLSRLYRDARKKIMKVEDSDVEVVFEYAGELEEEIFETFYNSLSEEERQKLLAEAKEKLGERARYMTEAAKTKSLTSYRNNILCSKFGLKKILKP